VSAAAAVGKQKISFMQPRRARAAAAALLLCTIPLCAAVANLEDWASGRGGARENF
jgi:hypothetical protein